MNTRDIADMCEDATHRRGVYLHILRETSRDGNFEEVLHLFDIVDRIVPADVGGEKG